MLCIWEVGLDQFRKLRSSSRSSGLSTSTISSNSFAVAIRNAAPRRLAISDPLSRSHYLIDTKAEVSVLTEWGKLFEFLPSFLAQPKDYCLIA